MSNTPTVARDDATNSHEAANRNVLLTVGLAVVVCGLALLLAGVFLGIAQYNSPLEQNIQRMMSIGTSDLEGMELPDGATVESVEPYVAPGPASYVFQQQPTWLGALAIIIGLALCLKATLGSQPSLDGESTDQVDCVPEVELGDEPFDVDD